MAMTSSVPFSGNADIDGVLGGAKWSVSSLTFSFAPPQGNGATTLNNTQSDAVREILKSATALTNLAFKEVAETGSTSGTLRFSESASQVTASAYYPADHAVAGDAMFNPFNYEAPKKGNFAYASFMHEIGHTLGLDHGQDGARALPIDHDSLEYSVMTYRSYAGAGLGNYTVRDGSYPRSFMLSDIAALQHMYGADYSTNATGTVYKWSPTTGELTINGGSSAKSSTNTILETIWDGGGVDTYDFSAYATGVKVDLRPGSWSTTNSSQLANLGDGHLARGNIANAYLHHGKTASLIENAKGGSGSDKLVGNTAANRLEGNNGNDAIDGDSGNDKIYGGAGNDTLYGSHGKDALYGGAGADAFVFNKALGPMNTEQIKDFQQDNDMLKLEDGIFKAIGSRLDNGEFYLGTKAHDSNDRILYDRSSGNLFYDVDGNKSGGQAAVLFATLCTKPVLDAGDFFIV